MADILTPEEVRRYQEAGQKERYAMPDLPDRLNALPEAGFKIHDAGVKKIIREKRADYSRYLTTEEGRADLHALTNVATSERRTIETLNRNLARFDRHKPLEEYRPELSDTDKWIKAGETRRRRRR